MNATETKNPKTASYLNRIRTARSSQPSPGSEEAYGQMEQVMATKIRRITPTGSAASKRKRAS
jgi:hypothetical protein